MPRNQRLFGYPEPTTDRPTSPSVADAVGEVNGAAEWISAYAAVMQREEAWRLLRGTRAGPGVASRSDRRAVYSAALEQAEQLFHAEQELGPAARPIDLSTRGSMVEWNSRC